METTDLDELFSDEAVGKGQKLLRHLRNTTKGVRWTTRTGERVLIASMESDHIINTISLLLKRKDSEKTVSEYLGFDVFLSQMADKTDDEWLHLFKVEMTARRYEDRLDEIEGQQALDVVNKFFESQDFKMLSE